MARSSSFICRSVLFFLALCTAASLSAADNSARTVRVLFIGNSFTYFNDLPALFADFAEATYPGLDVVTDSVAPSGETLKGHWQKGTALQKLQAASWDYVVLQEHGAVPTGFFRVDGAVRHEHPDELFDYGGRFVSAATAAKAKPVLYQTYAGPMSDSLPYLDYAYMTLGKKTGALVAPVGRVWRRSESPKLYHADGMHPSVHGSYLAAVTIAATLFGDPPAPAEAAVQHPDAVSAVEAREILAAVRSVREELAATGGYADVPAPGFTTRPVLQSALPIVDPAMEGTWSALDNALELSLGSRLTLSFTGGTPRVELVDYTLHGTFSLPVEDLEVTENVIRFRTTSQNRKYGLQLARRADGLEVLVEQARSGSVSFTHVDYGRRVGDEHFEFLGRHSEEISRQPTQESFEAALLRYYEALTARLGADKLSRILLGQTPLSDPWWSIMTGWELTRRNQHDAAVRFLTFTTHQFPLLCEAYQNLSEGLEAAGRIEEAYNAIFRAESLISQEHHPVLIAKIKESKARLEKLRAAAPAG